MGSTSEAREARKYSDGERKFYARSNESEGGVIRFRDGLCASKRQMMGRCKLIVNGRKGHLGL